jgi:hypothetical protein
MRIGVAVFRTVCKRCQKPFSYRRRGGRLRYYCDRRPGGAALSCKEAIRMESNRESNSRNPDRGQKPSMGRRVGAPNGPQSRDITRLPQWVQRRIAELEADLAAATQRKNEDA